MALALNALTSSPHGRILHAATPTQADFDACNKESQARATSPGAPSDSQLPGISTGGQSDPAYQQAYRECLKRRGF